MGYDTERFADFDVEANVDVICSICAGVFEEPVYTRCRHTFCAKCIFHWMGDAADCRCPLCNSTIEENRLRTVPRSTRNVLKNLVIRCDSEGCNATMKLKDFRKHIRRCPHQQRADDEVPDRRRGRRIRRARSDMSGLLPVHHGETNRTGRVIAWKEVLVHILVTIFYEVLVGHFIMMAILGFTFRNDCSQYPQLPWIFIVVGVFSIVYILMYATKRHLFESLQSTKSLVVYSFLAIAAIGQALLVITVRDWCVKSRTSIVPWEKPRIKCSDFLLQYSFWCVTAEMLAVGLYIVFQALKSIYDSV